VTPKKKFVEPLVDFRFIKVLYSFEFRSGLAEGSPFLLQISEENIQDTRNATASSPFLWTKRHYCPEFEPRFGG